MTAIAINPTNPSILYAAGETGGVFKTTDGGSTWLTSTDDLPNLAIADIQFRPGNPNTLFAGAGEGKLYKSTNAAGFWNVLATLPGGKQVDRIRIDPTDTRNMFAVEQDTYTDGLGVYKSTNSGSAWTQILSSSVPGGARRNDLAMDPSTPLILYAALSSDGVFKTVNGGATWTRLNTIISGLPTTFDEGSIAVAPTNPTMVYATAKSGGSSGFYLSTNGGLTWTLQTTNFYNDPGRCCFGEIVVDPTLADRVYFSHFYGLFKSEDRGVNLVQIPQNHVDQQSFAIQPGSSDILWAGNDGGLEKSINRGATWTEINKLPVTQFYELAVPPNNPNLMFGATQDNGVSRYGGSLDWASFPYPPCGDATGVAIDPGNSNRVYAQCYQLGFDESLDGGTTWHWASSGLDMSNALWKSQIGVFRGAGNTFYSGGDRVHKSRTINPNAGFMQHYFMNASSLAVPVGGTIRQWVYIPSGTPPIEIMLQFRTTGDGSFEHRAYWGDNLITFGVDGCPSRCRMGDLPVVRDDWVELVVNIGPGSANGIDLAGRSVDGLSYMLYDGAITWDHTAVKDSGGAETVWVEDDLPAGALAFADPPDAWAWQTGLPCCHRFPGGFKGHASNSTWVPISPTNPTLQPGYGLTATASSWTNQGRVYAAFGWPTSGYCGCIFRTDDGGANWTSITSPDPGEFISSIAVDPVDDKVVYVTTGSISVPWKPRIHIWKTTNATAPVVTWSAVGTSLPDASYNDIVISPLNRNRIVVVNGIGGVYQSLDGGTSWSDAGDLSTLPNTIISGVALEVGVDLTVSTYGRSMWRLPGSAP